MEIESKLKLNDMLTMEMVNGFLGVPYMMKRIIAHTDYNVVIDLSEDRLYILKKTGGSRDGKFVFLVERIYIWTRVVEMLRGNEFV